jgi:hypothetical protein
MLRLAPWLFSWVAVDVPYDAKTSKKMIGKVNKVLSGIADSYTPIRTAIPLALVCRPFGIKEAP